MTSPRATVLLASYNQRTWLPAAIESALSQTIRDLEVLVIDNGSTDGSPEVARAYESDPRLTVHAQPRNEPIGRRFNQGVELGTAPFISFLYSDDLLLPHKLERQIERFDQLPEDYAVVYSPPRRRNERTGKEWVSGSVAASGNVLRELLLHHRRGQIDMVSPLVRRSALLAQPFYEDVFAEGEAIFIRLAVRHRFEYMPEPVAVLRDHGGNAGKALVRNFDMTMVGIDRLEADPEVGAEARRWVMAYRRHLDLDYGWQAVRLGGDLRWGRTRLRRALRGRPYPKAIAGLAVSLLPPPIRAPLNAMATRLRGAPGNATVVADYEGLGPRPQGG